MRAPPFFDLFFLHVTLKFERKGLPHNPVPLRLTAITRHHTPYPGNYPWIKLELDNSIELYKMQLQFSLLLLFTNLSEIPNRRESVVSGREGDAEQKEKKI